MSQTKAQLVSGTTAQDLTVDNINTTSINSGQPSGRRNLIINGAMQVAQRGVSSTSNGMKTVDRFAVYYQNTDEAPTQAQVDVASGTTPYTSGFRKAYKVTNGNQTGGAGSNDMVTIYYQAEAQDIATSGWNYTSSSSYITLSFWVKSSVAQNFYGRFTALDSPVYNYPFETGSLSADTWTKITKTIPGNSNLVINNDNGAGLYIEVIPFQGTDKTGSISLNQWGAWNGSVRTPDYGSDMDDWYLTNDATFEITGVQLEVGSTATDFEHRSFMQELQGCQRYYCQTYNYGTYPGASAGGTGAIRNMAYGSSAYAGCGNFSFPVKMRTTPTCSLFSRDGTAGKINADGTLGDGSVGNVGAYCCNPARNNDSSGVGNSVSMSCHVTADAEL